eukprot:m.175938 g.175938  ORF g.175938 m.175938 type:complete len:309 (-) comp31835_c7_seq3:221-1147(-)
MEVDDERMCWICHLDGGESQELEWVSPCRCKGSTKWVHQRCILRWINDPKRDHAEKDVCPNCRTAYTIYDPLPNLAVRIGDRVNKAVEKVIPAIGVTAAASVLWAGLGCYSAVTIVHIFGNVGKSLLLHNHPARLFVTLPLLPLSLVAIRFNAAMREGLEHRRNQHQAQGQGPPQDRPPQDGEGADVAEVNRWDPLGLDTWGSGEEDNDEEEQDDAHEFEIHQNALAGPVSFSRLALGGLALPYVASAVGYGCFGHIKDLPRAYRTIYGGIMYMMFKRILQKLYRTQKQSLMQQRRVYNYVNYEDPAQ